MKEFPKKKPNYEINPLFKNLKTSKMKIHIFMAVSRLGNVLQMSFKKTTFFFKSSPCYSRIKKEEKIDLGKCINKRITIFNFYYFRIYGYF